MPRPEMARLGGGAPRTSCAGTATLATVVVLEYATLTRHVAVDVGDCSLITSRGTRRILLGGADGLLLAQYVQAGHRR